MLEKYKITNWEIGLGTPWLTKGLTLLNCFDVFTAKVKVQPSGLASTSLNPVVEVIQLDPAKLARPQLTSTCTR